MSEWQPIETAPRDGTEFLAYRPDAGVLLCRWTCPYDFLTDKEIECLGLDEESASAEGWFYADFVAGDRLDEPPELWQPFPEPPK